MKMGKPETERKKEGNQKTWKKKKVEKDERKENKMNKIAENTIHK